MKNRIKNEFSCFVNIGCGNVYHRAWINLDYAPVSPDVIQCDLRRGLPFSEGEAAAVYHSHVLDHLTLEDGLAFLQECRRILRPGGILRVAVPDYERLARAYLAALEEDRPDMLLLEWLRLELFDQFERVRSGGRMVDFVLALGLEGREKVRARIGLELDAITAVRSATRRPFIARLRSVDSCQLAGRLHRFLLRTIVRFCGGRSMGRALDVGLFRGSGEVHRMAYDRRLLGMQLQRAGLRDIRTHPPADSRIPDFESFNLETVGGMVRKPDSLFMEGVKV